MKLKNTDIKIKKVSHETLQKMYYGDNPISSVEYVYGFLNNDDNTIYISNKSDYETVMHEIAHAIFLKYYYNALINLINDRKIVFAILEIIADCVAGVEKVVKDNEKNLEKIIKKERKNDKKSKK